jgi:hypothetical protein
MLTPSHDILFVGFRHLAEPTFCQAEKNARLGCLHALLRTPVRGRVARWHISITKNPDLGKFWRALQCKMLIYFMTIRSILLPYGIFVDFMVIWYIFSRFGVLYQEKSGNTGLRPPRRGREKSF